MLFPQSMTGVLTDKRALHRRGRTGLRSRPAPAPTPRQIGSVSVAIDSLGRTREGLGDTIAVCAMYLSKIFYANDSVLLRIT